MSTTMITVHWIEVSSLLKNEIVWRELIHVWTSIPPRMTDDDDDYYYYNKNYARRIVVDDVIIHD